MGDEDFRDVTGALFHVDVMAPPGRTTSTTTWSFSGAYHAQQLTSDSGFTNYSVNMADDANSESAGGFWDENPGSRTISVTVTYVGGGGGSKSITGTVVQPTGNIDLTAPGTPGIANIKGHDYLSSSTGFRTGTPAVDWTASIAPASTAGRDGYYGVIQTISPFVVQRSYTSWLGSTYTEEMGVYVENGVKTRPRPLLDDIGISPYYYLYPGVDEDGGLRTDILRDRLGREQ